MVRQPRSEVGCLIVEVSRSQNLDTHTHTLGRNPLYEWSTRHRGRYLHNIQQTHETNIRALSWIRTLDPSNKAATDLSLRPHSHRNLPIVLYQWTLNFTFTLSDTKSLDRTLHAVISKYYPNFSLRWTLVLFRLTNFITFNRLISKVL